MDLGDDERLENVVSIIERSYALIREAIKNNEPTGWFAESEAENGDEENIESDNDC